MRCSLCGEEIEALANLPEVEAELYHLKCLKEQLDSRWEYKGLPSNFDLQREKGVTETWDLN